MPKLPLYSDAGNAGLSKFPKLSTPQISDAFSHLINQIETAGSAKNGLAASPKQLNKIAGLATDLQRELAWAPFHFKPHPIPQLAVEDSLAKAQRALDTVKSQLNASALSKHPAPVNALAVAHQAAESSKGHWTEATIARMDEHIGKTLHQAQMQLQDLHSVAASDPSLVKHLAPFALQEQRQSISNLLRDLPQGTQLSHDTPMPASLAEPNLHRAHQNVEALKHGLDAFPLDQSPSEWQRPLAELHNHAEAAKIHWSLANDLLNMQ